MKKHNMLSLIHISIHKGENGRAEIDITKCISCGRCMRACPFGTVIERSEIVDVLSAMKAGKHLTAMMAPAIVGQFPGNLKRVVEALRELGFSEVLEVASGADVTTKREAAEFVERMKHGERFMTTSCCPGYVAVSYTHLDVYKRQAYAHQRAAIEKLSRLRVGALFMDMGTGKTRTALELVWLRRKRIAKCVWCCPVSLMEETKREILRHTSCLDTDIHMIGPRTREKNVPQSWWHIVGLESLSSSPRVVYVLDSLIDGGTFLVVDESTYIKGRRAKRTRRLIRFGARTPYRLILTGTPIQQGIEDCLLYTSA